MQIITVKRMLGNLNLTSGQRLLKQGMNFTGDVGLRNEVTYSFY